MRKIGKKEIEDIAMGATVLGTGGGGDPHIGKLMALQAIEENGPIDLLSLDELNDDDLIVPTALMGAPTVALEKLPNGEEASTTFSMVQQYLGKKIRATVPIEAGGLNSMIPLALAAKMKIPVVDADGMGRAFPQLQMTTFYLNGVSPTPMVMADEKGNVNLMNTIDGPWAERIARAVTVEMGGTVMLNLYPMTGKQMKKSGIPDTMKLAQVIGQAIREEKEAGRHPINKLLEITNGYQLFTGKITDIERNTDGGFAKGITTIEGLKEDRGKIFQLHFQNEHLIATEGDKLRCATPDLIAVLDAETAQPITTEGLRYGARCIVIGMPCHPMWITEKAIEMTGPRYFGYPYDYQTIEELQRKA